VITIDEIQAFCLKLEQTTQEFPFDSDTLVFKVLGKIYLLCPLKSWESGSPSVTLKCDPNYAVELRNTYEAIRPGFHANKKHWNTLYLTNSGMAPEFIFELIAHSYAKVVENMPGKLKAMYPNLR
jgi:predicted DNA-binding protein (MmcQ/YjbR family)